MLAASILHIGLEFGEPNYALAAWSHGVLLSGVFGEDDLGAEHRLHLLLPTANKML